MIEKLFCRPSQGDMLEQLVPDVFEPAFFWAYRKGTEIHRFVTHENMQLLRRKKNMVFSPAFSLQDMISMVDTYEIGLWDAAFMEHVFDDAPAFADWLIIELLKNKKKNKRHENTSNTKGDKGDGQV